MSSLQWNGDKIAKAVNTAAKRGSRLAGEHLRTVSVNRAPLETGALRGSAKVTSDDTRTAVSYGADGPAAKYAVKQHEELGYRHKDGQAKYLESATVSERSTMAEIVAAQIRGAL